MIGHVTSPVTSKIVYWLLIDKPKRLEKPLSSGWGRSVYLYQQSKAGFNHFKYNVLCFVLLGRRLRLKSS